MCVYDIRQCTMIHSTFTQLALGWSQALLTSHSSKFQASSSKFQSSSKLEAHATSLTLSVFGTPIAPTESLIFLLLVIFNGQSLAGHHIT